MVHWQWVHPRTNHATFWSTLSVHPLIHLLVKICPCDILTPIWFVQIPRPIWGGRFVTRDMISTLFDVYLSCDIMFNLLLGEMWTFLSHNFWTHLWCLAGSSATCGRFVTWLLKRWWWPSGCQVKCGHFVTWSLDTFVTSSLLFKKMWAFCHMLSGHIYDGQAAVKRTVDVLSLYFWTRLWCPNSSWAKSRFFVT